MRVLLILLLIYSCGMRPRQPTPTNDLEQCVNGNEEVCRDLPPTPAYGLEEIDEIGYMGKQFIFSEYDGETGIYKFLTVTNLWLSYSNHRYHTYTVLQINDNGYFSWQHWKKRLNVPAFLGKWKITSQGWGNWTIEDDVMKLNNETVNITLTE